MFFCSVMPFTSNWRLFEVNVRGTWAWLLHCKRKSKLLYYLKCILTCMQGYVENNREVLVTKKSLVVTRVHSQRVTTQLDITTCSVTVLLLLQLEILLLGYRQNFDKLGFSTTYSVMSPVPIFFTWVKRLSKHWFWSYVLYF